MPSTGEMAGDDILVRLRDAFWSVPYPGDDNLVYDNRRSHLSCAEVRDKLCGLHWSAIPDDLIDDDVADLFFMTAAGIQFYLPGYIRLALLNPGKYFSLTAGLIRFLTAPEDPVERAEFQLVFGSFNDRQRAAIRDFLKVCGERLPADFGDTSTAAIESFWA
jgi:hypothetical protein